MSTARLRRSRFDGRSRRARVRRVGAVVGAAVCLWSVVGVLALPAVADVHASATIVVTTTADELNGDGDCSLREALRAANTDAAVDRCGAGSGTDLISLPAGTYPLSIAGQREDAGATGDLDITSDVSLIGSGAGATTIDGGHIDRVLDVVSDNVVTLQGLNISGGTAPEPVYPERSGSGIRVRAGNVTLDAVAITGNTTPATGTRGYGAGIANSGTMTIRASTVSGNDGLLRFSGGGLWNGGELTVQDSTISANHALSGAGISNAGRMTVLRSTVSGNTAFGTADYDPPGGGGIDNTGEATLVNVTVSGNTSVNSDRGEVHGAGISTSGTMTVQSSTITANVNYEDSTYCSGDGCFFGLDAGVFGPATLRSTIVAGNVFRHVDQQTQLDEGGPADCGGGVVLAGYDVVGSTCAATTPAGSGPNVVTDEPGLGPLGDNGGRVATHALQLGSPALDAGDTAPAGAPGACPSTDARGEPRPQPAVVFTTSRCDAGAFERAGAEENLLQNASFESGGPTLSPWIFRHDLTATLTADTSTKVAGSTSAKVTVGATAGSTYLVQLRQEGLSLRAGVSYTVVFWAKASAPRTINARLQGAGVPYTTFAAHDVTLSTSWQRFAFTYTAAVDAPATFLGFNLAQATGGVWLDSVALFDSNRVRNGGFETGGTLMSPWLLRNELGSSYARDTTIKATGASAVHVTVPTASPGAFHVQLRTPIQPLPAGHSLLVTFAAKASVGRPINVRVQSTDQPYTTVASRDVNVTTAWTRYSLVWTPTVEVRNEFLGFNLAQATGSVWIDDVVLVDLP